jgi:hypothetical protein
MVEYPLTRGEPKSGSKMFARVVCQAQHSVEIRERRRALNRPSVRSSRCSGWHRAFREVEIAEKMVAPVQRLPVSTQTEAGQSEMQCSVRQRSSIALVGQYAGPAHLYGRNSGASCFHCMTEIQRLLCCSFLDGVNAIVGTDKLPCLQCISILPIRNCLRGSFAITTDQLAAATLTPKFCKQGAKLTWA